MKTTALIALACALAVTSTAQERRKIDPLAIYGTWLGTPGAPPADCNVDGYLIAFASSDGKTFNMIVKSQTGGVEMPGETITQYDVVPPPATAPASVEIFLSSAKSELGIRVKTGSRIELVPAGPDKTYPTTSLVLQRC